MALHKHLPIYKLVFDLLCLAADVTKNMPRDFKQSLGKKIHDECIAMMLLIARANVAFEGRQRAAHISSLLESLEVATLMIRVGHEKKHISHGLYAKAIQLTDEIGRQAGGWRKSSDPQPCLLHEG